MGSSPIIGLEVVNSYGFLKRFKDAYESTTIQQWAVTQVANGV